MITIIYWEEPDLVKAKNTVHDTVEEVEKGAVDSGTISMCQIDSSKNHKVATDDSVDYSQLGQWPENSDQLSSKGW